MVTQTTRVSLTVVTLSFFTLVAQAQPQPFVFEKVIDNSGNFQSFGLPDLNDAGQVGFLGYIADVPGLYILTPGQSPQLVVDTTGDLQSLDLFTKINNAGTLVGFGTTNTGYQRIFTGIADGSTTVIAQTNATFTSLAPGPSISDDGTVAFRGATAAEGNGIYTRNWPDPVVVVEDETGSFEAFFAPFINHQGDMSYFARYNDGPGAVFNHRADGTRVQIIDNTGNYSGILPYSPPNSHGSVALRGVRADGTGDVILSGDGDSLNVLVDDGSYFQSLVSDLAINDNGLVVFNPRLASSGAMGLYFNDGQQVRRIVGPGDPLFGSIVRDVYFTHALNASNHVAFLYVLENDEIGIATTQIQPEAPALLSAYSVKTHGAAGDLAIHLPLDGGGSEPRTGGPTRIVVTFDQDVYGSGGPILDDVSLSAGIVDDVTIDGNEVTVDLSGVPDATVLTVTFPGIVNDVGLPSEDELCIRVLAGDVNGDGLVSVTDMVAVRNMLNQPVTARNCHIDVNADGSVSVTDMVAVRNNLGASVGNCP